MSAFSRHKNPKQTPLQKEILESLRQTKADLDTARYFFDTECSAELVASTVYEINSLQEKYSFLITQAKKNNVVAK